MHAVLYFSPAQCYNIYGKAPHLNPVDYKKKKMSAPDMFQYHNVCHQNEALVSAVIKFVIVHATRGTARKH